MNKETIQASYLKGEINYEAYQKLLGRLKMVEDENKAASSTSNYTSRREIGRKMRQTGMGY